MPAIDLAQLGNWIGGGAIGGIAGWFFKDFINRVLNTRDIRTAATKKALSEAMELLKTSLALQRLAISNAKREEKFGFSLLLKSHESMFRSLDETAFRYTQALNDMAAFNPILAMQLRSSSYMLSTTIGAAKKKL